MSSQQQLMPRRSRSTLLCASALAAALCGSLSTLCFIVQTGGSCQPARSLRCHLHAETVDTSVSDIQDEVVRLRAGVVELEEDKMRKELTEQADAFCAFDTDKNGRVGAEELMVGVRSRWGLEVDAATASRVITRLGGKREDALEASEFDLKQIEKVLKQMVAENQAAKTKEEADELFQKPQHDGMQQSTSKAKGLKDLGVGDEESSKENDAQVLKLFSWAVPVLSILGFGNQKGSGVSFMPIGATAEEYRHNFYWNRSYFTDDQFTLQTARVIMLILQNLWLVVEFANSNWYDFIFYYTSWGMLWTDLALFSSIQAVRYPEWHTAACMINEIAQCLNLIVSFTFWFVLVPVVVPGKPIDPSNSTDLFLIFYMVFLHVQPLAFTTINIAITDVKFFKKDWTYCFGAGMVYLVCNYIGTVVTGAPIYPTLPDWKDIPSTLVFWTLVAFYQAFLYYKFCDVIMWWRAKVAPSRG